MRLLEGDENLARFSSLPRCCVPLFLWQKEQPKMISKLLGVQRAKGAIQKTGLCGRN